jgi:hypothetical protein
LGVDADRIESTVAQQRGNGRQIRRFNQAPSSVVAEPMRVNMRDIGATTEHCQQVANTAIRVWPALAAENGPFGNNRSDCAEGECSETWFWRLRQITTLAGIRTPK